MSEQDDHERRLFEQLVVLRTAGVAAANEAAESALTARSVELSRISHEIRTPMNTIIGLDHDPWRDVSDSRRKSLLDEVLVAANHLLALIDDVIDLPRLGSTGEPAVESNGVDIPPRETPHAGGRRILLVDDNTLNLEVGESLLRLENFEVDIARDGIEAVERASRGQYAAIFMDLQMPRMNGLEATSTIRRMAAHASTPIIAMTASVFEEDRRLCRAAGMNDLIAKPVDPAHLSAVLARWAPHPPGSQSRRTGFTAKSVQRTIDHTNVAPTVREQLLELQRLVAADDMSARDTCRRLSSSVLGPKHVDIKRRLDEFDYDEAAVLIAARLHEC